MEKINSTPTGKLNQTFLENVQRMQKQGRIKTDVLLSGCEKTMLGYYNNSIENEVTAVKINPKNGDFTVSVKEDGKLHSYVNPRSGRVGPGPKGKPMPFADWTPIKKDPVTGEVVDKNGLNEEEYNASKEIGDWWDTFWAFWGGGGEDEE